MEIKQYERMAKPLLKKIKEQQKIIDSLALYIIKNEKDKEALGKMVAERISKKGNEVKDDEKTLQKNRNRRCRLGHE